MFLSNLRLGQICVWWASSGGFPSRQHQCQICVWDKSAFGGSPQGASPPVGAGAKSAFGTNLRLVGVLRGLGILSNEAWRKRRFRENADFAKTQILRKHRFDENVDFAKTQIWQKRRFRENTVLMGAGAQI